MLALSVAGCASALWLGLAGCAEPVSSSPAGRKSSATGVAVAAAAHGEKQSPAKEEPTEATSPAAVDAAAPTQDPATAAAKGSSAIIPTQAAQPNTTRPSRGAVAGRTRDITFDDLKFEMEKGGQFKRSMLTPAIEALEGQHVRLRGFILPSFQQTGIKQFVLVRDNMECCFGPGAALYDCVYVEMAPGQTADYTIYPVAVEGVFHIKEWVGPDGKHLAIYSMEGQQAK